MNMHITVHKDIERPSIRDYDWPMSAPFLYGKFPLHISKAISHQLQGSFQLRGRQDSFHKHSHLLLNLYRFTSRANDGHAIILESDSSEQSNIYNNRPAQVGGINAGNVFYWKHCLGENPVIYTMKASEFERHSLSQPQYRHLSFRETSIRSTTRTN